jgi:CBS domain-containing protein
MNSSVPIDLNVNPPRRGDPSGATTVADAMISNPKLSDETATVADLRHLFFDSHVRVALVARDRQLIAVIERCDLGAQLAGTASIAGLGRLHGRIVGADEPLARVQRRMQSNNQRRLAVIDPDGELIGLLCLKHNLTGFCSDQDIQARMTNPN